MESLLRLHMLLVTENSQFWPQRNLQVYGLEPPSPEVLASYQHHLSGPIPSFVGAVVTADTREAAVDLATAYVGDRAGYANTSAIPTIAGESTLAEQSMGRQGAMVNLALLNMCNY
jgi:hypothetical protein